jgi:hypothetical protein
MSEERVTLQYNKPGANRTVRTTVTPGIRAVQSGPQIDRRRVRSRVIDAARMLTSRPRPRYTLLGAQQRMPAEQLRWQRELLLEKERMTPDLLEDILKLVRTSKALRLLRIT